MGEVTWKNIYTGGWDFTDRVGEAEGRWRNMESEGGELHRVTLHEQSTCMIADLSQPSHSFYSVPFIFLFFFSFSPLSFPAEVRLPGVAWRSLWPKRKQLIISAIILLSLCACVCVCFGVCVLVCSQLTRKISSTQLESFGRLTCRKQSKKTQRL